MKSARKRSTAVTEETLPWILIHWIPKHALRVMYVVLWLTCWILKRGFQVLYTGAALLRVSCNELTHVTSPQPETFLDGTRIQYW